jgi:acetylornithine deacetylase/succinyl-diaminopimelate desuccinylase-like protein
VDVADGFCAPEFTEQMKNIVFESTREVFNGKDPIFIGCGGSIPFMEVMSREFPGVAFLLTGVGFADSNAHSANENLRLGFCSKLTQTIALVLSRF